MTKNCSISSCMMISRIKETSFDLYKDFDVKYVLLGPNKYNGINVVTYDMTTCFLKDPDIIIDIYTWEIP